MRLTLSILILTLIFFSIFETSLSQQTTITYPFFNNDVSPVTYSHTSSHYRGFMLQHFRHDQALQLYLRIIVRRVPVQLFHLRLFTTLVPLPYGDENVKSFTHQCQISQQDCIIDINYINLWPYDPNTYLLPDAYAVYLTVEFDHTEIATFVSNNYSPLAVVSVDLESHVPDRIDEDETGEILWYSVFGSRFRIDFVPETSILTEILTKNDQNSDFFTKNGENSDFFTPNGESSDFFTHNGENGGFLSRDDGNNINSIKDDNSTLQQTISSSQTTTTNAASALSSESLSSPSSPSSPSSSLPSHTLTDPSPFSTNLQRTPTLPTLSIFFVSYDEPLIQPELFIGLSNYTQTTTIPLEPPQPRAPSFIRWSLNIPWSNAMGGYNGHDAYSNKTNNLIGTVQPKHITLSLTGGLSFIMNTTTTAEVPSDTDEPIKMYNPTCYINGVTVNAFFTSYYSKFSIYPNPATVVAEFFLLQLNLPTNIWDQLLPDPSVRFEYFHIDCGNEVLIYGPTVLNAFNNLGMSISYWMDNVNLTPLNNVTRVAIRADVDIGIPTDNLTNLIGIHDVHFLSKNQQTHTLHNIKTNEGINNDYSNETIPFTLLIPPATISPLFEPNNKNNKKNLIPISLAITIPLDIQYLRHNIDNNMIDTLDYSMFSIDLGSNGFVPINKEVEILYESYKHTIKYRSIVKFTTDQVTAKFPLPPYYDPGDKDDNDGDNDGNNDDDFNNQQRNLYIMTVIIPLYTERLDIDSSKRIISNQIKLNFHSGKGNEKAPLAPSSTKIIPYYIPLENWFLHHLYHTNQPIEYNRESNLLNGLRWMPNMYDFKTLSTQKVQFSFVLSDNTNYINYYNEDNQDDNDIVRSEFDFTINHITLHAVGAHELIIITKNDDKTNSNVLKNNNYYYDYNDDNGTEINHDSTNSILLHQRSLQHHLYTPSSLSSPPSSSSSSSQLPSLTLYCKTRDKIKNKTVKVPCNASNIILTPRSLSFNVTNSSGGVIDNIQSIELRSNDLGYIKTNYTGITLSQDDNNNNSDSNNNNNDNKNNNVIITASIITTTSYIVTNHTPLTLSSTNEIQSSSQLLSSLDVKTHATTTTTTATTAATATTAVAEPKTTATTTQTTTTTTATTKIYKTQTSSLTVQFGIDDDIHNVVSAYGIYNSSNSTIIFIIFGSLFLLLAILLIILFRMISSAIKKSKCEERERLIQQGRDIEAAAAHLDQSVSISEIGLFVRNIVKSLDDDDQPPNYIDLDHSNNDSEVLLPEYDAELEAVTSKVLLSQNACINVSGGGINSSSNNNNDNNSTGINSRYSTNFSSDSAFTPTIATTTTSTTTTMTDHSNQQQRHGLTIQRAHSINEIPSTQQQEQQQLQRQEQEQPPIEYDPQWLVDK